MSQPRSIIDVFLQPGEFYFGDSDTRIRTILGSCVSITMWHPKRLIGGMCHYMLPARADRRQQPLDGKYGEEAILMLLDAAAKANTDPHDYIVKLFGGGNMFPTHPQHRPCVSQPCETAIGNCSNISCKNGTTGRSLLQQYGFTIAAEHVGGHGHRQVIFEIRTGHVWMRHVSPN